MSRLTQRQACNYEFLAKSGLVWFCSNLVYSSGQNRPILLSPRTDRWYFLLNLKFHRFVLQQTRVPLCAELWARLHSTAQTSSPALRRRPRLPHPLPHWPPHHHPQSPFGSGPGLSRIVPVCWERLVLMARKLADSPGGLTATHLELPPHFTRNGTPERGSEGPGATQHVRDRPGPRPPDGVSVLQAMSPGSP